jgi:hypothetical protein
VNLVIVNVVFLCIMNLVNFGSSEFKDSKFTEFSCIIFMLSGRSYLCLRNIFCGCR